MTATLSTPRARAHALAAQLANLGELGEVVAEVVDGRPSCLDACRHDDCWAPPTVRLTATDPMTGTPIDEDWCSVHALGFARMLLSDPHWRDGSEPAQVCAEVMPT